MDCDARVANLSSGVNPESVRFNRYTRDPNSSPHANLEISATKLCASVIALQNRAARWRIFHFDIGCAQVRVNFEKFGLEP